MKQLVCTFLVAMCLVASALPVMAAERDATNAVSFGEYKVGPEDILQVHVWGDEQLSPQVVVRPDGRISVPLVGEVECAGRSVEDIRLEIERRVKDYVKDAPVSVMVLQVNSPKVYIIGKVNSPGMYIMGHRMSLTQALALAQGFNPFAETENVLLIRGSGTNQITYKYNYDDLARGRDLTQNVQLMPGDTIVVP
ncbi:MAG: polysaccharide biosynthesis/export family protein [Desulfovibrionaceae bacterium]